MISDNYKQIEKILAEHGHGNYHPKLIKELEEYLESKVKTPVTLQELLVQEIAKSIMARDLEAVDFYSKAYQRTTQY